MVQWLSVKRRRLCDKDPIEVAPEVSEESDHDSQSTGLVESDDTEFSDSDGDSSHGSYAGIVSTPEDSEEEQENTVEVTNQDNHDSILNGNYNGNSSDDVRNSGSDKTYDADPEDTANVANFDNDDSCDNDREASTASHIY